MLKHHLWLHFPASLINGMIRRKTFRSLRSPRQWLRRVDAITFPHNHSSWWWGILNPNTSEPFSHAIHALRESASPPISSREVVPSACVTQHKNHLRLSVWAPENDELQVVLRRQLEKKGVSKTCNVPPSTAPNEGPVKTWADDATRKSYFGHCHKIRLILTLEWRRRHAIVGSSCQLHGCRLPSRGSFSISETDRSPTWFPQMKTEAPRRALHSFCRVFIWSRRVVYCFAPQSPRQRNVWVNNNSHSRWLISTATVQSTD